MHTLRQRYLELLKRSLLNELHPEMEAQLLHVVLSCAHRQPVALESLWEARSNQGLLDAIREARAGGDTLVLRGLDAHGRVIDRPDLRNYAEFAHTLIGRARLDHLQHCAETLLREGVEGDFLEAGVWRGGACVLLAGVLAAHDDPRKIWLADSFRGVPPPRLPEDGGWDMSAAALPVLAVSESEVRSLFERYDLLTDRIRFLNGWFRDTLPAFAAPPIALLRIDADLYESTRDVLVYIYKHVVDGGYVVIDDYGIIEPCRRAVDEFRRQHGIDDELKWIDAHGVYWRRGVRRAAR